MASTDCDEESAILEVTSETKIISNCSKSDSCNNSNDSSITETNGLQSPSAESISTFQDMDRISELILEPGQDIVARVDNPQKVVEPMGTYVSFRIRTKCKRWDEKEKEYVVRRRYNDFKALRSRLVQGSLVIVPPLPCRHTLVEQLDRYSRGFVLQRLALLNIFIKRLTTHSILSHSEDLRIFLTASQSEVASHFKSKTSYLSTITDSLYNLAGTRQTTPPASRVRDPEFASATEYMTALRDKLERLASVSNRVNKERMEMAVEMQNLRPMLESWSQVERFNRDTLKTHGENDLPQDDIDAQVAKIVNMECRSPNSARKTAVAGCTNHRELNGKPSDAEQGTHKHSKANVSLGDILKRMSKPFHVMAAEHACVSSEFPYSLGNPVQEYLMYVEAARMRLKERDALQANLEAAREKAAKKQGMPDARQQAVPQEVEEHHDRLQCASEALRSDLHGWHRQKTADVKSILTDVARRHIEAYTKQLAAWEGVLQDNADPNGECLKQAPGGDSLLRQTLEAAAKSLDEHGKDNSDWQSLEETNT